MSRTAPRLPAALAALILPPLGPWLRRGPGLELALVTLLSLAALVLFWTIAAGPGLALWGLSMLLAAAIALRPTRRRR